MICPKCGKEILEGHMYCEECGYEIHLVPEFEANVEEHITESIQSVVDKANLNERETELTDQETVEDVRKKNRIFYISTALVAILIFVLVAATICGITIWKRSSFIQEMLVEYYIDDEDYEKAITYLSDTISEDPSKISLQFKLAELYMTLQEEENALAIYDAIATNIDYTFEERVASIEHIVSYYASKKNYRWISNYLNELNDEKIQMAFLDYMVAPVEFSQREGSYSSLITLKLSSNAIGTIYYTTDGTKPTKRSPQFTNTIFLEAGENVVSALFVNDYGVESNIVTKTYTIEYKRVSPPEVLTYSGTYQAPVKILLEKDYNARVYYTTDGSIPNRNSNLYTGELYIPVGKSTFKFVAIDTKGDVSEVVTRDYELVLDTTLTVDMAKALLVEYLVGKGNQTDGRGHILQDSTHIFVYEYLYPISIETGKDCYYFAEVLRDTTTDEQSRTNTYYAVDIHTNKVYVVTQ